MALKSSFVQASLVTTLALPTWVSKFIHSNQNSKHANANTGVAKAVLAKLKLPGKLDFDRREVKYDVEENLNLSLGNFRLASSEPCGLEDVDKEEFNKYFAEATDMLNEIRRREAWKRGVVWQEPKNESEGSPLDFNQN